MQPVFKKGRLLFEKETRTFEYDEVLRDWRKIKEETEYLEPEQVGLKKEVEFQTLLVREGTSDFDLRRIRRWFLLSVKVKIPRVKSTKHAYLKLLEPDKPFFENFLPHYAFQIGLGDKHDFYDVIIKKKEKISEKKAKELISKGFHVHKEISGGFAEPI